MRAGRHGNSLTSVSEKGYVLACGLGTTMPMPSRPCLLPSPPRDSSHRTLWSYTSLQLEHFRPLPRLVLMVICGGYEQDSLVLQVRKPVQEGWVPHLGSYGL